VDINLPTSNCGIFKTIKCCSPQVNVNRSNNYREMQPLLRPIIDMLFSAATSAGDNSTNMTHFGSRNGICAVMAEAALALNFFETL
jgi:hypothetical protein